MCREKRTQSLDPCRTEEEVLYHSTVCAAGEKRKNTRPLVLRVRDEHGCMGNKVDTLRHAGRLHPPRRGSRCADVEQGYTAVDRRRSEARVNLKRKSSSWKDEMREVRHEGADECSQPTLVWTLAWTLVGRVAQQPRRGPTGGACKTCKAAGPSFPSPRLAGTPWPKNDKKAVPESRPGCGGYTQAASGMTPAVSAILRGSKRGVRWPLIRCSRRCLRPTVAILETAASRRGVADGPRSGYLAGLRN